MLTKNSLLTICEKCVSSGVLSRSHIQGASQVQIQAQLLKTATQVWLVVANYKSTDLPDASQYSYFHIC